MITEDFCSFEIAKLLKEKGFNESCDYYYDQSSDEPQQLTLDEMYYSYDEFLKAPTLQMAMKWLREVHNIHCDIHLSFSEDPKNYPSGYYIYILNTKDGNTVENPGNNISEIHPLYKDKSCTPRNYHTYEDAVEAALKYSLENLI